MDLTSPQNKIKPLPTHSIHIKSPFTYKNYLLKRLKHTLTFKFTRKAKFLIDNPAKAKLKLQKAFSLLKSVKKVDLSQFQINNWPINHKRLQSCFKRISKISTLLWTRYQPKNPLKTNLAQKSFNPLFVMYLNFSNSTPCIYPHCIS